MKYRVVVLFIVASCFTCCGNEWVDVPGVLASGNCTAKKAKQWSKRGYMGGMATCAKQVRKQYAGEARCDGEILQVLCK